MTAKYSALLGAALMAALALPAYSQETAGTSPRTFASTDIFDLEYAADPRISPDGRRIVYERRSNDIMTDRTRSNIWIVDSAGGNHRPLLSGSQSFQSPRWSPSGDRIAYLASERGDGPDAVTTFRIMVRWMDTGQTAMVASVERGPSDLTWSPDGRFIAFAMAVPEKAEPFVKPPAKPDGAEWAEPVKLIDKVIYRFDGRGYLEDAYTQIFIVPADGGTPRQLTGGSFNNGGPLSFSPDGSEIFFSANHNDDWEYQRTESDIFSVNVDSGALRQLTDKAGGEASPKVSPDGRTIAFIGSEAQMVPYRRAGLRLMNADGSNVRALTADLDRSVSDIEWASNGRGLYFAYNDHGARHVAYVSLSGNRREITGTLGGTSLGRPYTSGSYTASDNGRIAFTAGLVERPSDVGIVTDDGVRRLTRLNEDLLGAMALGDLHEITYPSSFDGQQIQGWYLTPPDFDPAKKYPLILEIHGGPHSSYGPNFSAEMQRYAAAGYIVFFDNYRGSTSYGEAFALLLQYKYSSPEDFADHMSGIDALIAQGFVDPDNLFVTGGSAGGIATAYAVGLTDRFRGAVAAKPVINWISKTLTGDIYTYQIPHQFPGLPWDELEHYWQRSPLSLVGNVTTPTMLITGEQDFRTPSSEAEQFYQALKLRHIDTAMVRVPGASHNIAARPSNLIAKVDHVLAWFAKYRADPNLQAD